MYWQGLAKEIEDITGIGVYVGTWSGAYAFEISDYAALLNAVLGLELTEADLMHLAKRSRNLEKAFNTLHTDLGRADDMPPLRYINEPIKTGPYKGHRADPAKWRQMLDEYYELHDWDPDTGMQTRRGLTAVDLESLAEKLAAAGRLK